MINYLESLKSKVVVLKCLKFSQTYSAVIISIANWMGTQSSEYQPFNESAKIFHRYFQITWDETKPDLTPKKPTDTTLEVNRRYEIFNFRSEN